MDVTLVVPCYNEEPMLPVFWEQTRQAVAACRQVHFTWLFVNDGSTDNSLNWLKTLAQQNPDVKVISLSRNFGKEAAVTAGLAFVAPTAKAAIVIDADLQDPPSLIGEFIQQFEAGYEVVYGVRTSRKADSWIKRTTAHLFYKGYNAVAERPIPAHASDCRLISRRVLDALLTLPERERFMKGLFNWVGFKSVAVPFVRQKRAAGSTKWNYWKLWNFALQGLTAGSTVLLRLWAYIGMCISLVAVLFAGWVAFKKIVWGNPVSGYASLMVAILFCSGVQLISLGIMGEYLSRIFVEVKQRPLYLVDEKVNF